MRRRTPFLLAAVTLAATLASAEATADGRDARARAGDEFRAGQAAFRQHEYIRAAEHFERAAAIAPHAATLLNAAEAWEAAGDLARAADLCDRVVSAPDTEARYLSVATRQLERLAPKIATIAIVGDASRRVRFGSIELPVPLRRRVMPGPVSFSVVDPETGRTETREVVGVAGETTTIDLGAAPARPEPQASAAMPPPARRGPPVASWIAFGVAAAGAGGVALFGVRTLDAKDAYERAPTLARRDAFYTERTLTDVALGTAVVAAAVGIVLWVIDEPARHEDGVALVTRF